MWDGPGWGEPEVATGKAGGFVHAEHGAALRAVPFLIFGFDKGLDAGFLDALQVGDGACPIFRPVAFVQVVDALTGELVASEAKIAVAIRAFLTHLYGAAHAVRWFECIVTPAAGTRVFVSGISPAQAAVDAAWGDQGWAGGIGLGLGHSSRVKPRLADRRMLRFLIEY